MSFFSTMSDAVSAAADTVASTASAVADVIVSTAQSAVAGIKSLVSSAQQVANAAVDWIVDKARYVGEVISDAAGKVYEGAKKLFSKAKALYLKAKCNLGKDDEARRYVSSLTKEQIRNLPTAQKNALMRALLSGYVSDDDKKALKKLYSVKYLDPEFEKIDKANRANMVAKIKGDPDIAKAKANWSTMSEKERLATLQKVADYQADAYGIEKTELSTFDQKSEDGYITNGYYDHSDGKLNLNTNSASSFHNFDDAMDTVTHENAHRYQHELIDQVEDGSIAPGDPRYEQAETFRLNNEYYTDDKPQYFTQPMETHSRETGAAANSAVP